MVQESEEWEVMLGENLAGYSVFMVDLEEEHVGLHQGRSRGSKL